MFEFSCLTAKPVSGRFSFYRHGQRKYSSGEINLRNRFAERQRRLGGPKTHAQAVEFYEPGKIFVQMR